MYFIQLNIKILIELMFKLKFLLHWQFSFKMKITNYSLLIYILIYALETKVKYTFQISSVFV